MTYPHKKNAGGKAPQKSNAARDQAEPLDFNPQTRVRNALRTRSVAEGITIDPPGTHIIDDGLFIRRHGKGWLIKTSVADLPAIIPPGSQLESVARSRMKEQYVRGSGIDRIWPVNFLDNYVSLQAGKLRPAVTFTITLDENLNVEKYKISRTAFESQGAHHDGSFKKYPDFDAQQQREWRSLAQGLYLKRNRDLAAIFDRSVDPQAAINEFASSQYKGDMDDGRLMVHEVMRLTNHVATDFLRKQGALVPYKEQSAYMIATHVSPRFDYDLACNQVCDKMVDDLTKKSLPYVHLNSPMRRYTDYLSLKILGQLLSGTAQDLVLKQEVIDLTSTFNAQATGKNDFMLRPSWRGQWQNFLSEQAHTHPFDSIHQIPGRADAAAELKNLCRVNGWQKPLTAERVVKVQNALIHFVGMKLTLGGADIQAYAFSHDQDHALRLASRRILQDLGGQGSAPATPKP